ncbi:MAG: twin-arginine translocation signal domain-containing protein, partial [Candidatus Hydrogenedentes bacterium]|nr:twin-arginine translocation signal domain-containing protein [Candidatus Hydrogenedentota bacterium]
QSYGHERNAQKNDGGGIASIGLALYNRDTNDNAEETVMSVGNGITRRGFLKSTGLLAAGAAAFQQIVGASVLGKGGERAPNDRIVVGCIGVGGMGRGDMGNILASPDAHVVAGAAPGSAGTHGARSGRRQIRNQGLQSLRTLLGPCLA